MDDTGVVEEGEEVRFHSTLSWVSWLQDDDKYRIECIDASTGMLEDGSRSAISSAALAEDFLRITKTGDVPTTLRELRELKRSLAAPYEAKKDELLGKHPVLCDWNRREY